MKSKTENRLTQSALKDITNSTTVLFQDAISQTKRQFEKTVMDTDISDEVKQALITKMDDFEYNLFDGLDSEHMQEKYYKEHFGYLVSETCHHVFFSVHSNATYLDTLGPCRPCL